VSLYLAWFFVLEVARLVSCVSAVTFTHSSCDDVVNWMIISWAHLPHKMNLLGLIDATTSSAALRRHGADNKLLLCLLMRHRRIYLLNGVDACCWLWYFDKIGARGLEEAPWTELARWAGRMLCIGDRLQ